MPDLNMPSDTMKVQPDIGTVLANLLQEGATGPMADYAKARINGSPVAPELARAAFNDAKKLVDAGHAANQTDVSLGGMKSISVGILEGLLADIQYYAKVASSRESMYKLANKFERLLK